MKKAIFIAPSFQQACYWANQWGYSRPEIEFIASSDIYSPGLRGFHRWEWPVFTVGPLDSDLLDLLYVEEFNVYDGQDIQ